MKKFKAKVHWSGYSRGYDLVVVEAENIEDAGLCLDEFQYTTVESVTVRDDRERDNDYKIKLEEVV